jgi:hypothetical protein
MLPLWKTLQRSCVMVCGLGIARWEQVDLVPAQRTGVSKTQTPAAEPASASTKGKVARALSLAREAHAAGPCFADILSSHIILRQAGPAAAAVKGGKKKALPKLNAGKVR